MTNVARETWGGVARVIRGRHLSQTMFTAVVAQPVPRLDLWTRGQLFMDNPETRGLELAELGEPAFDGRWAAATESLAFLVAFVDPGVREHLERLASMGAAQVRCSGVSVSVLVWGNASIEENGPFMSTAQALIEAAIDVARRRDGVAAIAGCASCGVPLDRPAAFQSSTHAVRCDRCGLTYHDACRGPLVRCWRWGCDDRARTLSAIETPAIPAFSGTAWIGRFLQAPAPLPEPMAARDGFAFRCPACGDDRTVDARLTTAACARCRRADPLDVALSHRLAGHLESVARQRSGGAKPSAGWHGLFPLLVMYACAFALFGLAGWVHDILGASLERGALKAVSALMTLVAILITMGATLLLVRRQHRPSERHPLRRARCDTCGAAAPVRRGFSMPCPSCSRPIG